MSSSSGSSSLMLPGLTLIAAMSSNRVIGRDGQLPWRISGDLKRFKALTSGHPVIMGRKTWASLGKALPARTNIVLSRQGRLDLPEGVFHAHTVEEALRIAGAAPGAEQIFIIGGGEIYGLFLPVASRLELTLVEAPFEGDACFPVWDEAQYEETGRSQGEGPVSHFFVTYERKRLT